MSDCPFCEALKDENNNSVIYEDEKLAVIIPKNTVSKGHLRVIPKDHKTTFQEFDDKDIEHLFYAASFTASALFEKLEAHGTNIIANTGSELNKNTHFHIDVIARWGDDKLNFLWTPKRQEEDELKAVQDKIKDKTLLIGVKKKQKEVIDLDRRPVEKLGEEEKQEELSEEKTDEKEPEAKENKKEGKIPAGPAEESYLIKQLRRMP